MIAEVCIDNHGREYVPTDFNTQDIYVKKRNEINTGVFNDYDDEISFTARIKRPEIKRGNDEDEVYGLLASGTLILLDSRLYDYTNKNVHDYAKGLAENYWHIAVKKDCVIGYWDVTDDSFTFEGALEDFTGYLKSISMGVANI